MYVCVAGRMLTVLGLYMVKNSARLRERTVQCEDGKLTKFCDGPVWLCCVRVVNGVWPGDNTYTLFRTVNVGSRLLSVLDGCLF